jgi:hypothetical protein
MGKGPNVHNYDRKLYKKCIKCRSWKPKEDVTLEDGTVKVKAFGPHEGQADGYQVICYQCKGTANKKAREKNVAARIRHHTATRCLTQLGQQAPENFTRDMEDYLGYKIRALVRHLGSVLKEREGHTHKLKDALSEGYHIDHIRPLSSFVVVRDPGTDSEGPEVDWDVFRECWSIDNLVAIPAEENLAKGATYTPSSTPDTRTPDSHSHNTRTGEGDDE